jgi:hypothetical protein
MPRASCKRPWSNKPEPGPPRNWPWTPKLASPALGKKNPLPLKTETMNLTRVQVNKEEWKRAIGETPSLSPPTIRNTKGSDPNPFFEDIVIIVEMKLRPDS